MTQQHDGTRSTFITVRLTEKQKAALMAQAEKSMRTVSSQALLYILLGIKEDKK